jgi:hypothetical protein
MPQAVPSQFGSTGPPPAGGPTRLAAARPVLPQDFLDQAYTAEALGLPLGQAFYARQTLIHSPDRWWETSAQASDDLHARLEAWALLIGGLAAQGQTEQAEDALAARLDELLRARRGAQAEIEAWTNLAAYGCGDRDAVHRLRGALSWAAELTQTDALQADLAFALAAQLMSGQDFPDRPAQVDGLLRVVEAKAPPEAVLQAKACLARGRWLAGGERFQIRRLTHCLSRRLPLGIAAQCLTLRARYFAVTGHQRESDADAGHVIEVYGQIKAEASRLRGSVAGMPGRLAAQSPASIR